MKATRWLGFALVLCACRKAQETDIARGAGQAAPDAASKVQAAIADAATDVAQDCPAVLAPILEQVQRMFRARDSAGIEKNIRREWGAVEEPCRIGAWYGAAAAMMEPPRPMAFEAPGVKLERRVDAIQAALAQPVDLDVLRITALLSRLEDGVQLPADACDRAREQAALVTVVSQSGANDRAHYVCGHAALVAGDGAAAEREFGAIAEPSSYGDLDLRRSEAVSMGGDRASALRFAKQAAAMSYEDGRIARIWDADRKAIVEAAKRIVAGKDS